MRRWVIAWFLWVTACSGTIVVSRIHRIPAATGFLADRWYIEVVAPTNTTPLIVGTIGATNLTIDWGDGNSTTVTFTAATKWTNTYATAGTLRRCDPL